MFSNPNPEKIFQSVAVLLERQSSHKMDKLRLLKLLYIAERESFAERGRPILGVKTVAMDHGPLHSIVLDYINGQVVDADKWGEYFQQDHYQVHMIKQPSRGELSSWKIGKLNDVWAKYEDTDTWTLVEETHKFEEWSKNHSAGTSCEIPIENILSAVNRADDSRSIAEDIEAENRLDQLLRSARE